MENNAKLAVTGALGSISWFAMDGFWMFENALVAQALAVPTVLLGLMMFLYPEPSFAEFYGILTGNIWSTMNVLALIGDFNKSPESIFLAKILFTLGIIFAIVGFVIIFFRAELFKLKFRRFINFKDYFKGA